MIRSADPGDAEAIAAIYAHHVLHGTASFDTAPPDAAFWRAKIADIVSRGWPFLVVVEEEAILGYAYATQFRDRPAYAETCENSIYVAPDYARRGVGSTLVTALLPAAAAAGFRQMIAVVGGGRTGLDHPAPEIRLCRRGADAERRSQIRAPARHRLSPARAR